MKYKNYNYRSRVRKVFLKYHKLCEFCGINKELEVHHKIPIACGGFSGWANLQTLCKKCHKKITAQQYKDTRILAGIFKKIEKELYKRGYSEEKIYQILSRFIERCS